MPMREPRLLLAALAIALAGCSTDPALYPSLSIRDAERVSGTFEPVEPERYVPPPPGQPVLDELGRLRTDAAQAHQRFLVAAQRARGKLTSARGAQQGSEAWSVAQVLLADVESSRSDAMVALADLDRIYVTAQTDGDELTQIEAARDEVSGLVAEEDRVIDSLHAELGG